MNLKVFTAFSGYDSQCMALDRLHRHNPDFNYELVGWAEIDKYAIAAHNAVYPQWAERNYGDIAKIDWAQVPDFDLFTYSSPCQDFSQAGKQAGGTEGSGTRSSLLWECRRAILAKKPKYLLMENVAALVSQKFIRLFNAWQLELESYGYRNFAKVLNAKDYGVPQNRERIFMVSVLDEQARYEFPDPMPLTLRLKDVLEPKVDEKYYIKHVKLGDLKNVKNPCILTPIRTPEGRRLRKEGVERFANRALEPRDDGTCNALTSVQKDNLLIEPIHTDKDGNALCISTRYAKESAKKLIGNDGAFAMTVIKESYPLNEYEEGVARTIKAQYMQTSKANFERHDGLAATGATDGYRIRKLTERECFRLMDVPEEYIDRIQAAGISRSQQYKMAGNSIVVSCMYHIWRKLWIDTQIKTLTLF